MRQSHKQISLPIFNETILLMEDLGRAGDNIIKAAMLSIEPGAVEHEPVAIWIQDHEFADVPRTVGRAFDNAWVVLASSLGQLIDVPCRSSVAPCWNKL